MAKPDLRIAVAGASGVVGAEIVELLEQRDFPQLRLARLGAPRAIPDDGSELADDDDEGGATNLELRSPDDLSGFDVAFLALPAEQASEIVAAAPGPVLIDLSAMARAPELATMLAAPGLTPRERILSNRTRIFSPPHPAAQAIAAIHNALHIDGGLIGAQFIQGASADGREALAQLFRQSAEVLNARLDLPDDQTQIAFNLRRTARAVALGGVIAAQVAELRGGLTPSVQVMLAPVFHGSMVTLFAPPTVGAADWEARLRDAPGIVLLEPDEDLSVIDAVGQEAILTQLRVSSVGVIVECAFDAARLAALSAVWIAEVLFS